MNGITKLIFSLGSKGVSLLAIGVSCFVVVAGFLLQQQITSKQSQDVQLAHQKQVAQMVQGYTVSRLASINEQMAAIAGSKQIVDSLTFSDSALIELQQQELKSYFPNAKNTCLIRAEVDEVTPYGCMPITFATLNSLRQAKKDGAAQVGVIKQESEEAVILLAHRITNKTGQAVGVLVVTLADNVVPSLIYQGADFKGYIELQQGTKTVSVLTSHGDSTFKQGAAQFSFPVANSYWRLAIWQAQPPVPQLPIVTISVIVAVMVLMWIILEAFKAYIIKRDASIIRTELDDLKAGGLKARYLVLLKPFEGIVTDILDLARENYHNTAKKGATAESISKKIEEVELSIVNAAQPEVEELREIVDINPAIFRANDIRGIIEESIDEHVVKAIGHAVGSEAQDQGVSQLVVARDARLSSATLSEALIEGVLASGCDVIDIGEVPTPVMYFSCEHFNTRSGVMVTGSHNAAENNGLKIQLAGKPVAKQGLQKLHQRIRNDDLRTGEGTRSVESINYDYVSRIVGDIKLGRLAKVVIDCGNGVAGSIAPALFKAIGCEVIELFCDVDGSFPNHHPNPSQPENLRDLSKAVKEHGAELGIAFDGDGDRLGVVDSNGLTILPDRLLMLFAQDILSRLPGSVVLYDVKCSSLLGEEIAKAGGEALMSESGHSLIKNKMQAVDAQLAGELSGHIFIKERWYGFDDALYAACRLLEILTNDLMQRNATEIFTALPSRESTPEILVSMAEGESQAFMLKLAGEGNFDGAELVTLDGVRAEYQNGWGLVRASNTMPGLTLRFEADTAEELQEIQQRFKEQMLQIKPTLKLLF
jgi:phosphomannomutase/phosphoglucomutase